MEFSDRVAQYLADQGIPHVNLKICGTKKQGKYAHRKDPHAYIGVVEWAPVKEDGPADEPFVGDYLAFSEKASGRLPRMIHGKVYHIAASDPENHEVIASCTALIGEEETPDHSGDPFADMFGQIRDALQKRVVDEVKESIMPMSRHGGPTHPHPNVGGHYPPHRPHGGPDLIPMSDGTYVNREWVMNNYVHAQADNERLRREIGELREMVERGQREEEESGGGLMDIIKGAAGALMANPQILGAFGGGGGGNAPGMVSGLSQLLGGFMKQATPQSVAGPGSFDQSNPFSSFLANVPIDNLGGQTTMPHPTYDQSISSSSPFGGMVGGGSVGAPPYGANPLNPHGDPYQPQTPEIQGNAPMAENELTPIARDLLDILMKAFMAGGEEECRLVGKTQLVAVFRTHGWKDSELMLRAMDAQELAKDLLDALPKERSKGMIDILRPQIEPVVSQMISEIDWKAI